MVLLEGLSVNCFPYQVPLTQPAQEMFAIPQDYEAIPSCLIPYSTIARGEAPVLCYFSPCILLNGLTSHFPRKTNYTYGSKSSPRRASGYGVTHSGPLKYRSSAADQCNDKRQ